MLFDAKFYSLSNELIGVLEDISFLKGVKKAKSSIDKIGKDAKQKTDVEKAIEVENEINDMEGYVRQKFNSYFENHFTETKDLTIEDMLNHSLTCYNNLNKQLDNRTEAKDRKFFKKNERLGRPESSILLQNKTKILTLITEIAFLNGFKSEAYTSYDRSMMKDYRKNINSRYELFFGPTEGEVSLTDMSSNLISRLLDVQNKEAKKYADSLKQFD